ncbi:MAG: HD-GYP domain-containing protein [Nitrosomonas sp.]|nr:HD-GYP domain-containing protein [Nitrosomonas sp.]MCW5607671.1 HD-GYP domain-containing protein [Nitrosomonas sp.]
MIKKIAISEVRLGMYIHKISENWMQHPFWKSTFLLSEQADLEKLKHCNLEELWIDTSKGLDVLCLDSKAANNVPIAPEPVLSLPAEKRIQKTALVDELVTARKVHAKTRSAVVSMFSEARMGKSIQVEEAVILVDEINMSMERNANALLSLIRLKTADEYTYLHSVAVCVLMVALGKQLGLYGEELKQIGVAGLLHDIGKMAVPNEILNKPDKLTDKEFEIIKTHPRRGWEILKKVYQADEPALDVCLHHHERVDGKGYPEKLSADTLTLHARMGAVCDVYDAITSDRCYKKGWEPAEAIRRMTSWKDGHFDETVFRAFVKTIGIYPIGTLLKLRSGRLGLVIEQSEKSLLTPLVKVFFSTRTNGHIPVEIIDMSKSEDSIVSAESPEQWGLDLGRI